MWVWSYLVGYPLQSHGGQKKKVGHLTPSDTKPFPRLWGQIGDPIVPSTSSTYPWRKYLNLFCVYTILIKPKQKFAKGLKGLWGKNKNATKPQSTGMQGVIFLNRCMYPENLFSGNHGGQKKKFGHLIHSDTKPFPRLSGPPGFLYHLVHFMLGRLL